MSRIAIVTKFHKNNNFGAQLQAYALQRVISSYGFDCEVIDYNPQNKYKKMKALSVKTIASRFYHKLQLKIHQTLNARLKSDFSEKAARFRAFMQFIPHTKEINYEDVPSIASDYDFWVTGSDQVWNPEAFTGAPLLLLKGVNGTKLSYAASSLNANYSKEQAAELKSALDSFQAISVREKGLEKAIAGITGKPVTTVLDPTLLLNADDWNTIAVDPAVREKYAFVYLVGVSDEARKHVYRYCRNHGLKMIIVPHAQGWYKSADEKYYDIHAAGIGPAEWVGYIKNAEIVFTDSFHGTVFSVNYHKPFFSFENLTEDERKNSGLRKYSILKQLGLSERCVPYSYDLESGIASSVIDYEKADSRLNELRRQSRHFLETALGVEDKK